MGSTDALGSRTRLWQIDVARGASIIVMVAFHVLFDLRYFDVIEVQGDVMRWAAMAIGSSFLVISGISLSFEHISHRDPMRRHVERGTRIFAWGIVITIFTYIVVPERFVVFGILHCIGVSTIIASILASRGRPALVAGIATIVVGILLQGVTIDGWWLVWLGVPPTGFSTLDYYPLLPWSGMMMVGVWLGNMLVARRQKLATLRPTGLRAFEWVGRHSLTIYLVHQPLIVIVLMAMGLATV